MTFSTIAERKLPVKSKRLAKEIEALNPAASVVERNRTSVGDIYPTPRSRESQLTISYHALQYFSPER